jgi:preprotein translocase subunit YajC
MSAFQLGIGLMRLILGTITAIGLALSAPAAAQSVGMQVVDTAGAPVGTVTAVQGDNLQIKTDKHDALLPKTSFSVSNGKLLFGMTQAQLDAEIEKSLSAANGSIVTGATVKGTGGAVVGKIDSVADGKVIIALQSGKKIAVAQDGVRGNPDGTVTVGLSADQLEAQVASGSSAPAGE